MSLSDQPVDSVRERVTNLLNRIEHGHFGKNDVESLAPELRAALQLPDMAPHQRDRLRATLDELRFSAGLHRTETDVMFVNNLIDWLDAYGVHLAEKSDRQAKALETTEKNQRWYSREVDRLRDKVGMLETQRAAVRDFFSGKDDVDE